MKSADYLEPARKPRKIVIGGDNDRPALLQEACRDCDVLVHEATYTADIALKVGDVGHSSAQQVARFAASAQIPNLVLTHFSPRYQAGTGQSPSIQDIHAEARAAYSGELFLAEDFARYRLDRKGAFRLLDGST